MLSILAKRKWRSLMLVPGLMFASACFANEYVHLAANLPATLPPTVDVPATLEPAGTINTPEYVIIQPSEQVTFSSEAVASVAKINVKEGSRFLFNDILLELDCRIQKAELKKVQAQLQTAQLVEKSAAKLKSYGSISELELVKARSDAQIASAEVDKLRAIVDKCVIRAPFNGAVEDVMVNPYETVKPGDPLLKIISIENLEFEIQVPSSWLTWLHVGTQFNVSLNETNKTVTAQVVRIDPHIESVSQTIKITGAIKDRDLNLLPGMSGQAIFPENPENKR